MLAAYPPFRHYVISRYSISESTNSMMSYLVNCRSCAFALDEPGPNGEAEMNKLTFTQRLVLAGMTLAIELVRLAEIALKYLTNNYKLYGTKVDVQV